MTQKTQIDHVVKMTADVGGLKITDLEYFSNWADAVRFAQKVTDYSQLIEVCGEWMLFSQKVSVFTVHINAGGVSVGAQEL